MKKFILILLLLPVFCSSQVILDNVTKMCMSNDYGKTEDCVRTTSNMSVYIKDDVLFIKSDVSTIQYEIDAYYVEDNGDKTNTFDILMEGVLKRVTYVKDKYSTLLVIADINEKVTASFWQFY